MENYDWLVLFGWKVEQKPHQCVRIATAGPWLVSPRAPNHGPALVHGCLHKKWFGNGQGFVSEIPYCGVFARMMTLILTALSLLLVAGCSGFSYYCLFHTQMYDSMLAPFTGQESYHNLLRGKNTKNTALRARITISRLTTNCPRLLLSTIVTGMSWQFL